MRAMGAVAVGLLAGPLEVAAARLDDLLTWPAARLGAGLACLLAPMADGDVRRAWQALRRDGASHPSPNAGGMEAAFVGALGVRLGGRNQYGDRGVAAAALATGAARP
jgi:adenosylcobinamide-phosphate synthase